MRSRRRKREKSLSFAPVVRALLASTRMRASCLLTPMGSTEEESAPPAIPARMVPAIRLSATFATAWKLVAQARLTLYASV